VKTKQKAMTNMLFICSIFNHTKCNVDMYDLSCININAEMPT